MTTLTIDKLVEHVTENNEYDASGILVGVEQHAQSQYPMTVIPGDVDMM